MNHAGDGAVGRPESSSDLTLIISGVLIMLLGAGRMSHAIMIAIRTNATGELLIGLFTGFTCVALGGIALWCARRRAS